MFMRHPRLFKPGSIENVQIKIQIVDTHEVLEAPVAIGLRAFGHLLNRTLLRPDTVWYVMLIAYTPWSPKSKSSPTLLVCVTPSIAMSRETSALSNEMPLQTPSSPPTAAA